MTLLLGFDISVISVPTANADNSVIEKHIILFSSQ